MKIKIDTKMAGGGIMFATAGAGILWGWGVGLLVLGVLVLLTSVIPEVKE